MKNKPASSIYQEENIQIGNRRISKSSISKMRQRKVAFSFLFYTKYKCSNTLYKQKQANETYVGYVGL